MKLDIREYLMNFIQNDSTIEDKDAIQVPDAIMETDDIQMIIISEVVPQNPNDYFYSGQPDGAFMSTTIPIFNEAGINVKTMDDIIKKGIYITTAVKTPKEGYTIPTSVIKNQISILEKELQLFSNTKVIMLMGDVAKKAFQTIERKNKKKSVIPNESTYRIRGNQYYYDEIRVFPSYIITGGNLLIERSKVEMIKEDLANAMTLL